MGHTKANDLLDLSDELAALAELPGLKQKSPGIFYYKSISFMHFHDAEGQRWADVKQPDGRWKSVAIDFKSTKASRALFLKTVKSAYSQLAQPKK